MNLSNLRIIFQDIDGCLNPVSGEAFGGTAEWRPSSEQIQMLQEINTALDASSIQHFVLNTGRPWFLVQHIAAHLPSPKLRYCLLEHACVLYDRQENRYLDCVKIAQQAALDQLSTRYQNISHIQVLFEWYRNTGQQQLESQYQHPLPPLDKQGNLSFKIPDDVDGNELLTELEKQARADLAPEHVDHLEFMRSDLYIDILPGIHKLDGIHLMCAYLDLNCKQALAVGDYLNDLQIFEAFPRVFCPSNAHIEIQKLTRAKGDNGEISTQSHGTALLDLLKRLK